MTILIGLALLLKLMTTCLCETQILDYSNSQIIAIDKGIALLQTGTFKLIHTIRIDQYENAILKIEATIKNYVTHKDSSYPFLKHDIEQLKNILSGLKPRRKRSLNILGTAWKWLAGTPDHDDFQLISDQTNNLLNNNDKQVIINRLTINRLNEISKITNTLLNTVQSSEIAKKEVIRNLEHKLKIIKEELVQIDYSIQWAKAGIINSFILSNFEINITKNIFEEQKMPFVNLIEALEFSEVKIASNQSTLLYIVLLPLTEKNSCKKLLLKPVKIKNVSIKLEFENIILCENEILGIKKDCNTLNEISICKTSNFVHITGSSCIPNLIKSLPSTCITTNNQHLPTIEEITSNILLLNDHSGELTIDNRSVSLQGTFLIHHSNSTIMVQNQTFKSKQLSAAKPLPAIAQISNATNVFEEALSLQMLKELQITNTQELRGIKDKYGASLTTNFIIFAIIIGLLSYKTYSNRRNYKINIRTKNNKGDIPSTSHHNSEDTVEPKGGRVNTTKAEVDVHTREAISADAMSANFGCHITQSQKSWETDMAHV